jgi:type I restriction enzyme S subunit
LFFNYFSQQFKVSQSFLECSVGIVIEKMLFKLNDWLRREFLFPSLKEQQIIADCLFSLDDLIAVQIQKLDTLKAHKKGLMQQLFPAEGETIPKMGFPEFRDAGAWEAKPLSKVAKIITGNTPKTAELNNYGGDKLFVSPADISNLRYITTTKTTLSDQGFEKTRPINVNSILFVCIGSTIGKIAQNKFECATNQQINSVVPFNEYSNDFIYSILENNSCQIAVMAGKQAVPIINKTLFSSVIIPYPAPPEQQKIADCLSSLDELIAAQTQKIDTLKIHKKGLMQQLFPSVGEVHG